MHDFCCLLNIAQKDLLGMPPEWQAGLGSYQQTTNVGTSRQLVKAFR